MAGWADQGKPELIEMCRQRELAVSGTKEELIARLTQWELQQVAQQPLGSDLPIHPDEDPISPDEDDDDEAQADPEQQPGVVDDASSTPGAPPPEGYVNGLFRAVHPTLSRQIDDARHMQFIAATHEAAQRAGLHTRGAPWAGHRVGFTVITEPNGMPVLAAIYEVAARQDDAVG